ncbi:hypothetical protein L7F22_003683 [Adiantum nelumboides]|nr:hypothetical protein [Adiantum nelumboides]
MKPPWTSLMHGSLSKPASDRRCSGILFPPRTCRKSPDRLLHQCRMLPKRLLALDLTVKCSVNGGPLLHEIDDGIPTAHSSALDAAIFSPRDSQAHFVSWFREAWPYIQGHQGSTFVLVISAEILDSSFVDGICQDLSLLHGLGIKLVIIPGTHLQIDRILLERGQKPNYAGSYRITDDAALEASMEVAGKLQLGIEAKLSSQPSIPVLRRHGDNERWHVGIGVASGPCESVPENVKEVVTRLHVDAKSDGKDPNAYVDALVDDLGGNASLSQGGGSGSMSTHASGNAHVSASGISASKSNVGSSSKKRKRAQGPLASASSLQARKQADQALRRFFYAEDIPEWKVRSPFFLEMVKAIGQVGPSYVPPTYNALHTA